MTFRDRWFQEHNVTRRAYTGCTFLWNQKSLGQKFQSLAVSEWSPGDSGWSVGERRWGTGKTIGDLMLFWETNKGANVTPREACGPVGCHASWQMRGAARNWWAGFHNRASEWWNSSRRSSNRCACVTVCAFVIKVFGGVSRSEQLSRLVITSQQKQGWQRRGRERDDWLITF